ncbi:MAG: hypothetical protein ACQEQ4_01940 [Fibrobacterota bacterium]
MKSILILSLCIAFFSCQNDNAEFDAPEPHTPAAEADGPNLLHSGADWHPAADTTGSLIDTGDAMQIDSVITVHFTLAQKTTEEWPYVELICDTEDDFRNTETITITYTCDTPLILKLSQSDFGYEGNETYAHYEYVLPATEDWSKQTVHISDFEQPEWTPAESRDIPLKLENCDALYLTPQLDPQVGGESTLSVKHLVIK